ncbi:kinesin-like protein Klp61F [Ischnura elegans]|uniref:kinesin-like protein Klp61F n=1 Tax=Ischnura elegans TaxID=197161 RepID=UPI001ED86792|nr:kinesin-like protein Klp61F [Ischnura elegans]
MGKPQKENQNIQVFVRVRPQNQQERAKGFPDVIECPTPKEILVRDKPCHSTSKTFTFDHVFNMASKQIDVYRRVVKPLIKEVLDGYNCTVFAYGQTGTGKTYTMEGGRSANSVVTWENDPEIGIIPRTLSHLFEELRQEDVEFTLRVSFLELYNEELIDLLAPPTDNTRLRIFEDSAKKGSVIIQGLQEVTVHSKDDVYQILMRGSERRQTAATLMNATSSRSHTVFSVTVHIKESLMGGDEMLKTGKLNLVDLAGSENIGRSGAVEKRAREAGSINQSLLTLGRVITALVERTPHVPYRESKLTRLLQDSLGGRTKTCFIATISSVAANLEETLSTLDYAHRAKDITNKPEINQKLTKKELLKEYTEEIERLRRDLTATRERNGVYMDEGEYTRIIAKLSSLESENAEKYTHIKGLREEMEKMEELCNSLNMEVSEKQTELIRQTEVLMETEDCLERTKSVLVSTELDRKLKELLVGYHEDKQRLLSAQAHSLLMVADQSSSDASLLQEKLSRKRSVEEGNRSRGEQFSHKFRANVGQMEGSLEELVSEHAAFCGNLRTTLGELQEQKTSELTIMSEHLTRQVEMFMDMLHGMEERSAEAMRSAQHWIQNFLGHVRSRGALVEDLRTSMIEQIELPLQGISEQLRKAIMDLQALSNEVNDKIRDKEYRLEVYSLEAKDALNGIEESFSHYVAQRKQETERFMANQRNAAETTDIKTREMLSALRTVIETAQMVEESVRAEQQRSNESDVELRDCVAHMDALTTGMVGEVQHTTASMKKRLSKYVAGEKQTSEELQSTLREFVEKRTVAVSHMERLSADAVSGVRSVVSAQEEERRQDEQVVEERLRDHSEMLKRYLVEENDQTQALAAKAREMAEMQESHLEAQRHSFRSFLQERQDELEGECLAVRQRGQGLSEELRRRQAEMGSFFSNDLLEDQPTGETPPRRDYKYPRKLVISSPKEVVMRRLRAKLDSEEVTQEALERGNPKDESNIPKLSASVSSLPATDMESLTEPLSTTLRVKSASETDVPSAAAAITSFQDELENQENLKVTKAVKAKSRLRAPRNTRLLRNPLSERNDD